MDFLLKTKMCTTNGRISPELNDFTSKDRAVVDYIIVPHDFIDNCVKCEVRPTNDLLEKYNLFSLIGLGCKAPDHALITLTCHIEGNTSLSVGEDITHVDTLHSSPVNKRYYFDTISDNFMASPHWYQIVDDMLTNVRNMSDSIDEVDSIYTGMCNVILTEMDEHIKYNISDKKTRKKN